jgi:hypothetical protein
MLDAIAINKIKFRREPRRGDKIIAQGKRVSAQPWVGRIKSERAPEGLSAELYFIECPSIRHPASKSELVLN